jgi:hypothetical protein
VLIPRRLRLILSIVGVLSILFIGAVLLVLFTSVGRGWMFCAFYDNVRLNLLRRDGMNQRLRQKAKVFHVSGNKAQPGWRFLKLAGAHVPLPPGEWEIRASSPVVALASKLNPDYQALILSVDEKIPEFNTPPYTFFFSDLADDYGVVREMYTRDFSTPCNPRQSCQALGRDFILMLCKSVSGPSPSNQQVYYYPAIGLIATEHPTRRDRTLLNAHFKSGKLSIQATYAIKAKTDVKTLLNQLMLLRDGDATAPSLSTNLGALPLALKRLEARDP